MPPGDVALPLDIAPGPDQREPGLPHGGPPRGRREIQCLVQEPAQHFGHGLAAFVSEALQPLVLPALDLDLSTDFVGHLDELTS